MIVADLGDADTARMHAERGLARAGQTQQLVLSAWALHALGHAAMQRDDLTAAIHWFEQLVALARGTENRVPHNMMIASAAEAYLECGRFDEARQLTDAVRAVAELADSPQSQARATSVHARLLAALGQHASARKAFDEAVRTFTGLGSRLELGRTLYHRAVCRLRHGEHEPARADALRARDLFAELGAVRDRERVERLL